MNNIYRYTSRSGVTLVEILVAVALLSTVMIPVLFSFTAGSRGLAMSAEDLTIHTAAIELLEQVMAAPFDLVPAGTYPNGRICDGQPFSPATPLRFHISDVPGIERELEIAEITKNDRVCLKKATVTITLTLRPDESKAQARRFSLKCLLAKEN